MTATTDADPAERARAIVEDIPLGRRQRRIVDLFVARFGRWTSTETLREAVWADDPEGGPASARQTLAAQIHHIRRRLGPHGLTIQGHSSGNRRLIFTSDEAHS